MTISVAIICRNSSDVIEKCLESVKEADEIVVVDTGSFDNTMEIAKRYTDKVYEYWGCNEGGKKDGLFASFADARNKALEYCTMTHILTIDTDEILTSDINEIKEWSEKGRVSMAVKCTSAVSGEIHYQPRVHIRHKKVKWFGAAHNYLNVPLGDPSNVEITYYKNEQKKKRDPDRTMRILRRWVKNNPRNCTRELYYLAKEYFNRSWHKKSLKTFKKYISRSKHFPEKADAFVYMARCEIGLNNFENAKNYLMGAININPEFAEPKRVMGELSNQVNRLKWKHLAHCSNNSEVLFLRKDNRMKVTILSRRDWAGSGYDIMNVVRVHSEGYTDIEAITELEGQGSEYFFIPTGASLSRLGKEVIQARVDVSDIIHIKGDWEVENNDWCGIDISGKKLIYTVSGSEFRENKRKFKADYLSALTPDLCIDGIEWTPHAYSLFSMLWKKGKRNDKFRIVHSPTNREIKGSDVIAEAIKLLGRKDVEYIDAGNLSYADSINLKSTASLYIDQINIGSYGKSAVEAMSMGVPVFCTIDKNLYPDFCPIISPENNTAEKIAEKLNEVLDWNILSEISAQSLEYCKKIHGEMGAFWNEKYKSLLKI